MKNLFLLLILCWNARARVLRQEASRELLQLGENRTACQVLGELPPECLCAEPHPFSLLIQCVKNFESPYWNDTVGVKLDLNPCDPDGSKLSLDITEANHGIDYPISQIRAGEEKNYPIPGASIHVPGMVNVGLDATVLILGNLDQLTLKVGLNACAGVHNREICASSIPGLNKILPWWILNGTYAFGDLCEQEEVSLQTE